MERLGIAIIGTAIIWAVVIIGSAIILRGTPYNKKIAWLLIGGAVATWLLLAILNSFS